MPTMQDVAKHAGVALSTVSYALNGTRPISEKTRQRIFAAMEELGYRPNALARGLASKNSRIIALLFPDLGAGLGVTALGFFFNTAEEARALGYNLVLWPTVLHAKELEEHLRQGLVDGVVVMEIAIHDERIDYLRNANFPFSMIGRTGDNAGLNYVDFDIHQSIHDAVNYLIALGHRHIAFIDSGNANDEQGHGPSVRSQAAFREAVQVAGVEYLVCSTECAPISGYEIFNSLLEKDPELTALVTINDYAVPGIVQAIANHGWSVPQDFSIIVGPTSTEMAEMVLPPLTSIDIPIAEMSRWGVKLLIHQLENQEPIECSQVLIPCELIVRGSTGPIHEKEVKRKNQ